MESKFEIMEKKQRKSDSQSHSYGQATSFVVYNIYSYQLFNKETGEITKIDVKNEYNKEKICNNKHSFIIFDWKRQVINSSRGQYDDGLIRFVSEEKSKKAYCTKCGKLITIN